MGAFTTTGSSSLFGSSGSFFINTLGIVQQPITATSADGEMSFTIPSETVAKDKNGNALTNLTSAVNSNPPAPSANASVIGLAYTFGPDGATFNPPFAISFTYSPATLPAGVTEDSLTIAYFDSTTAKWENLPSNVNKTTHAVTAGISHFSGYALLGTIPAALPPTTTPAAAKPVPAPATGGPSPTPVPQAQTTPTAAPPAEAIATPSVSPSEEQPEPTPFIAIPSTEIPIWTLPPSPARQGEKSPVQGFVVAIIIAIVIVVAAVYMLLRLKRKST